MSPDEERQRALSRERLVEAALSLVNEDGLEGLSMRALADRLEVKAASLYWHVRDRRELLALLAESILDSAGHPRRAAMWRGGVENAAAALARVVAAQRDAARILLEAPEAIRHSDAYAGLKAQLEAGGLTPAEAADTASMVVTYVIGRDVVPSGTPIAVNSGEVASLHVDSGSRGVVLRAGPPDMQTLIRVPQEQNTAAPAVTVRGTVVVRRLRGVGRGELELNPRRAWRFKVQAPTWNTLLDVGGLDVRGIHVDSGAANLECFLPEPRGVVPVHISSGVAKIAIHRPRGTAVVSQVSAGAVKIKLDDFSAAVTVSDLHWQSDNASQNRNRYELQVGSGAVKVSLDSYAPGQPPPHGAESPREPGPSRSALDILLDGVEAQTRAGS